MLNDEYCSKNGILVWTPSAAQNDSWFDYRKDGSADYDGMLASRITIMAELTRLSLTHNSPMIILGGMSQGAAMAMEVSLYAPRELRIVGCFCLRGCLEDCSLAALEKYDGYRTKTAEWFHRPPKYLIYHGLGDRSYKPERAIATLVWLVQHRCRVEYIFEEFIEHVTDSEVEPLKVERFIAALLTKSESHDIGCQLHSPQEEAETEEQSQSETMEAAFGDLKRSYERRICDNERDAQSRKEFLERALHEENDVKAKEDMQFEHDAIHSAIGDVQRKWARKWDALMDYAETILNGNQTTFR